MKRKKSINTYFKNNFSYDLLTIYDGGTTQSGVLGEYCGYTLPPNLVSSTNMILIFFHSGGSILYFTENEFKLEYNLKSNMTTDCNYDSGDCCANADLIANGICKDETNNRACMYDGGDCCLFNSNKDQCSQCVCSSNGAIISPDYPQNYENNLDLSWLIVVPSGQTIEINFISLAVEYDGYYCR